jgi:hypothetical protein
LEATGVLYDVVLSSGRAKMTKAGSAGSTLINKFTYPMDGYVTINKNVMLDVVKAVFKGWRSLNVPSLEF